jgi:hypothetical protein
VTKQATPGKFEIGRILHLKFETRKLKVDWPNRAVGNPATPNTKASEWLFAQRLVK